MSEAQYAELREKVKGPEDLKQEMEKNEAVAELKFAIETEPAMRDALRDQIQEDMMEQGIEEVLEYDKLSEEMVDALESGDFDVVVESADDDQDRISVAPEGNVTEAIPVKLRYSETYTAQFQQSA